MSGQPLIGTRDGAEPDGPGGQGQAEPTGPAALAEPTTPVRTGWTVVLALANLGLWMGYWGPLQVLLPDQMQVIDPAHKTLTLGVVTGIGAGIAMIVNPVAGALSDRTTSRFGRRRPWALAGALIGALGLAMLSGQAGLAGVIVGWCIAQAGLNVLQAAITAVVPDQVPVAQRATISGWISVPQSLGVVVGVIVVSQVVSGRTAGYLMLTLLVVLLALPFVLFTPDPPLPRSARPAWDWRSFRNGFWISPRAYPDFAWAWLTRFLVQLGNAMAILYLLYYLRDQVRYEQVFPGQKAEDGLLTLILIYTAAAVIATVIGGMVSDRSGRRKRSVTISGLLMAVPGITLAFWPTWNVVMASAVVLGVGFGVYMSVDQALVTQVLPAAQDRARDLGVINIANSAPQVLGPALAAPLVAFLGGYPALYLAVAVVTVLGSVLVWKIRSVP